MINFQTWVYESETTDLDQSIHCAVRNCLGWTPSHIVCIPVFYPICSGESVKGKGRWRRESSEYCIEGIEYSRKYGTFLFMTLLLSATQGWFFWAGVRHLPYYLNFTGPDRTNWTNLFTKTCISFLPSLKLVDNYPLWKYFRVLCFKDRIATEKIELMQTIVYRSSMAQKQLSTHFVTSLFFPIMCIHLVFSIKMGYVRSLPLQRGILVELKQNNFREALFSHRHEGF